MFLFQLQHIDFIHFMLLLENHAAGGNYLNERSKLGHTIDFTDKNVDMQDVMKRFKNIMWQDKANREQHQQTTSDLELVSSRLRIEKPVKKR